MANEVLYEAPQVLVTERVVTIGATSYPIASITAARLNIVETQPGGLFGLFRRPIRTAKLFLTINTGMVHELANEDIEGMQKLRDAIGEAFARRK